MHEMIIEFCAKNGVSDTPHTSLKKTSKRLILRNQPPQGLAKMNPFYSILNRDDTPGNMKTPQMRERLTFQGEQAQEDQVTILFHLLKTLPLDIGAHPGILNGLRHGHAFIRFQGYTNPVLGIYVTEKQAADLEKAVNKNMAMFSARTRHHLNLQGNAGRRQRERRIRQCTSILFEQELKKQANGSLLNLPPENRKQFYDAHNKNIANFFDRYHTRRAKYAPVTLNWMDVVKGCIEALLRRDSPSFPSNMAMA